MIFPMIRLLSVFILSALAALGALACDFTPLDSAMTARYAPDAPGCAIIVAQGDSVLYERYAGLALMSEATPVGPDTRFCIASVSKQFTVMALLQQQAAMLDTSVSQWFAFPQPFWQGITLRHLASHTSGVPDSRPRTDRDWCVHATDLQSVEYFPAVDSLRFGPGEYYDYLNPSFILLAQVVEKISGQAFVDYMREHVFVPAGMSHTYYFSPDSPGPGESHGYEPDGGEWREFDYGEETFYATRPDGGIYSTARDLLRWENALRDGLVVSPDRLRMAYTPLVNVAASPFCDYQQRPDTWYGLGFFIDHPAGRPVKVYHTGDNGGYQAYLAKYPASDIKIIVLENRHDHSRWELATLIDRILGMR